MSGKFLALTVCVLLLSALTLNAKTVLTPTDDTFIRAGTKADSIYGALIPGFNTTEWNYLRVRSTATAVDNIRNVYIKFDLNSITGNVNSAILKLTVNMAVGTTAGKLDHADFYTVPDDNWSESTMNWNNAPKRGTLLFGKSFKRKLKADADPTYYFDLTSYVKAELAGNKLLTIHAVDDSVNGSDLRFYSKEAAQDTSRPQLIIETGSTGVAQQVSLQPGDFGILQNYPNPFNPETWISFELSGTDRVAVDVLDMRGQRVKTLVEQTLTAGTHRVRWDGTNGSGASAPAGVYFTRIQSGAQMRMIKMALIR